MVSSENERPQSTRSRRGRATPLWRVLLALILLGLVPTGAFSAGLILWQFRQQQSEMRRTLSETVNALAQSVDAEVLSSLKRLELLASSPTLRNDLRTFERVGRLTVDVRDDWSNLVLVDESGQQLLNLAAPEGAPLPSSQDQDWVRAVLETKGPVVTGVVIGQVSNQPSVRVAQPVMSDGAVTGVLAAELDLTPFERLLSGRVVRHDGIGAVLDDRQRFIARSRDSAAYLGMPVIAELGELIRKSPEGTSRNRVYDGPDVYSAWTRAPLTGWTITLGIPAAPLEAALRRSLYGLGGAAMALFFLVGIAAVFWARRVARSIASASDAAVALAERRPLPPIDSAVLELDALARALSRTSDLLRQQGEERDRLLASETEARAHAEQASRAKDEFLAMLGHELRNPLAAIRTAVALLELERDTNAHDAAKQMIGRQAAHLTRLVDDLLDVARVAAGKVRIEKSPLRLDEHARRAVEAIFPPGEPREIVLDTSPVWVHGDPVRIEQVVTNLIVNARKFTPEHGRITVRVRPDDDTAVLEVSDNGQGIPEELLPRVFGLFVQGRQTLERGEGGLGIGLTLVHHLVEKHGGEVKAESKGPGQGSTFRVRLPRIDPPEAERSLSASPEHSEARRSVVVIEDNDDARDALVSLLRAWGHKVSAAADGRSGLALFESEAPDVALIDLGLPVLDGYGVARALRGCGRSTLLYALTGYGGDDDRARTRAAGFDRHLVKPVDPDELQRILSAPLGERRATT